MDDTMKEKYKCLECGNQCDTIIVGIEDEHSLTGKTVSLCCKSAYSDYEITDIDKSKVEL
jgi:hypothetical protein